jgi:hypothetical protein
LGMPIGIKSSTGVPGCGPNPGIMLSGRTKARGTTFFGISSLRPSLARRSLSLRALVGSNDLWTLPTIPLDSAAVGSRARPRQRRSSSSIRPYF